MITIEITPARIRQLLSKGNVSQATTAQAEAFLTLYGEDLMDYMNANLSLFVAAKKEATGR